MARYNYRRRSSGRDRSAGSAYKKGFAAGKKNGRVSVSRFRSFTKEYAKGYSAGVAARRSGGRRRRRY